MDGAGLLQKLFSEQSEHRELYDKVMHGVELTRLILESDPSAFDEVAGVLAEFFAPTAATPSSA